MVILCRPSAYESTFVAHSENLLETSNSVFTDWALGTYFGIDDEGNAYAHFEVKNRLFGNKVLFETNSYKELLKWYEDHAGEINEQLETKKAKWIEEHGKVLH